MLASMGELTMRVLTYNICGNRALRNAEHVRQIAAVINESRADIVGLQEVHQVNGEGRHGDQPEQLRQLTGLNLLYWPHLYHPGGTYGNAILTRGRIRKRVLYRLPGHFLEARALLEARLELDGEVVDFFCTH